MIKAAGIKLWVLTGDKIETAVNIGYSCGLLDDSINQYIIEAKKTLDINNQLEKAIYEHNTQVSKRSAIIVGGESLIKIFLSDKLQESFMKLAGMSVVVLACRVSPKQKAQIV